ncbi:MAG: hypothetical protein J6S91_13865, partial [Treponema sp.]|nr:hypothetical protein [Treponema sp.]
MPGLSQLKQFNADMLNVGDEVKIRSARGEKPVTIGIPKGIDFEDDSEDFRAGMPQLSEEEQQQAEALAAERDRAANDFSDITGETTESSGDQKESDVQAIPDVSDLFSPAVTASVDDLDLSEFETEKKEEEVIAEEPKETPIEDLDLDALLAPSNPGAQVTQSDEEDYSYEEAPAQPYRTGRLNPHNLAASKEPSISDLNFDALIQNADDMAETPSKVESTRKETVAKPTAAPKDFDIDDANADFETDASLDLNETIPEEFQEHPAPEFVDMDFDKKETVPAEEKAAPEMDLPDFDVEDEFDNAPEAAAKTEQEGEEDGGGSFSMDDMDLPDFSDTDGSPATDSSEDLDNAESTFLDGSETPPEDAPAEENNDEPLETYDISAMEDMDFSAPGAVKDNSDFDMGDVDGMEMSDDDFEIPNFTTTEKDPFSSFSSKKASVSTPDFKEALEDEGKGKPKNSFTDAEYKRFRKNL